MATRRKPDGELARPRHRRGGDPDISTRGTRLPAEGYEPNPDWHPTALRIYNSVAESGSRTFFQQSDWAMLYSVCEDLSVLKFEARPSAVAMQTVYGQLNNFLLTESDRRKVRIELHAPVQKRADDREIGQNVYSISSARSG